MKSNLEELKALRNNNQQTENRSKSQQSPADTRPFKEPEQPIGLGLNTDAAQLEQDLNSAFNDIMAGLGAADMHWVAQTIIDEVASSTNRAQKLSEVIEHFRNPETTVKMAYILAGKKIAGRQSMSIPRPAFSITLPALPSLSVPDFSRFYSSQDLSAPQLAAESQAQTTSDSQTTFTSSDKSESV